MRLHFSITRNEVEVSILNGELRLVAAITVRIQSCLVKLLQKLVHRLICARCSFSIESRPHWSSWRNYVRRRTEPERIIKTQTIAKCSPVNARNRVAGAAWNHRCTSIRRRLLKSFTKWRKQQLFGQNSFSNALYLIDKLRWIVKIVNLMRSTFDSLMKSLLNEWKQLCETKVIWIAAHFTRIRYKKRHNQQHQR